MDGGDEMRRLLLEMRERATGRLERFTASLDDLVAARRGESDDDEHDPEGVTLSSEWSRLAGLVDGARAELSQLDEALLRLHAGSYGVCLGCGERIPLARLEARPFADRCVPCASRARPRR